MPDMMAVGRRPNFHCWLPSRTRRLSLAAVARTSIESTYGCWGWMLAGSSGSGPEIQGLSSQSTQLKISLCEF